MRSLLRSRSPLFVLSTGLATFAPLVMVVGMTACGGGDDAKPAPVAPVPTATAPVAPPVDLSAVAEPQGLVLSGRILHPEAALKEVGVWTGMPMPGPEALSEMIAGGETGKLLDTSKPLDFAMSVTAGAHPKPSLAISAAVSSMDEAKATLGQTHKLVPADNGVFIIRPQGASDKPGAAAGDDDDDDSDDKSCSLAPAFGDAPARLVCGVDDRSVTMLLPYLTRTATRSTSTKDVHLDIRPLALKPLFEMTRQLIPMLMAGAPTGASGQPVFDLINAFAGDLIDFSGDAKQVTLDMSLTDAGIDMHGVTNLQTTRSLIASFLAAHPERADAPPPQYFKLPADADLAGFSRGSDPAMWQRPLQLVGDALASVLQNGGVTEGDAKAVDKALVDALTPTEGPSVSSHGVDGALIDKAVTSLNSVGAGDKDGAKKEEAERVLAEARIGWWVVGHSEDAATMTGHMKELVAAWNRPSLAKTWKANVPMMGFPKLHAGAAGAGAPKGAQHFVLEIPRPDAGLAGMKKLAASGKGTEKEHAKEALAAAAKSKPFIVHLYIVGDGPNSWLAVGGDEGSVIAHLKTTLAGADGTLGSRAGLDKLKNGKMTTGGFFDMHGLFGGSPLMDWMTGRPHVGAAVAQARSKAGTPVVFSIVPRGPSADAPAGSSTLDVNVPAAAISEATRAWFAAFAAR